MYVPGKDHANADVFSCLPLPVQPTEAPIPQDLPQGFKISPVSVKKINSWINHDPVLAKVHKFEQHGWPRSFDPVFNSYYILQKFELSIQDNCISS